MRLVKYAEVDENYLRSGNKWGFEANDTETPVYIVFLVVERQTQVVYHWNRTDSNGKKVDPGVYLVKISCNTVEGSTCWCIDTVVD